MVSTLPLLPITFPKRTTVNRVADSRSSFISSSSHSRLLAPITLQGSTALSVEIATKRSTPAADACRATTAVPITLLRTASVGWLCIR